MNTSDVPLSLYRAERRVLEIQTKLHRWANDDPHRRFDDLYNLVTDPSFLLMAWDRVAGNKGARSAGVDGMTAASVRERTGEEQFLAELREQLKSGGFRPLPVRERMIPKPGTRKRRRLGIPTVADRVVQASLKLVLEPIFEADFVPCSYGFRPNRRAHDAMAETRFLASKTYEWVLEGDITACFDEISHTALMDRVRDRIGDKRVLALVKAFLKAGILTEVGTSKETVTGTPQGGILSPLLANVALSVLDEHFAGIEGGPQTSPKRRFTRRQKGLPNYRLIRYADDFVILVSGTRAHTEALLPEVAEVLSTVGLRLSEEKTLITHIDVGLDFLGWRIQRHRKRGTDRQYVYNYPAKKALRSIKAKTKAICRMNVSLPLAVLLHKLNQVLRGWTAYFRPGVSARAFQYLRMIVWRQVFGWLRRKHPNTGWKELRRRYCNGGWWPHDEDVVLFNPGSVVTTRYRPRGTTIPSPWPSVS
ncbi:group II intron reverse transcriptase/maturase [Rhodococcus wratislaviensis]|uniref:Putative RNA-directed DNA polymerase n=1 Tax=Rhodococcus wratislaviensis NBRC 100605 TaxID=1219028 RepID=X0QKY6_RHOWR|nr:group II intron reverse transcriptase/maturase [Rhodococcus wratislaviensis]GAF51481.1 putative RNA-directed DNA polymerase [Rhodococcus wratislaviensis NBRC 100605]